MAHSLGPHVIDFIESNLVVPDGEFEGEPFTLSAEQKRFINGMYMLVDEPTVDLDKPSRAFAFPRGGQLVAPQKWGKGPLSAAWVIAEAWGPVLFDGFVDGQAQARPWATPWIQVTAVSEDQTANIWRVLLPMVLRGGLAADIPDTGQTRINLPNGGRIEIVTASARSRLGQRITASAQDEAHDWLKVNGGRKLADTQRRNLAGMGGRFMETGNAWDPNENSVAQTTFEDEAGVFKMMLESIEGSILDRAERMPVLEKLYGGSPWVDTERISEEIQVLVDRAEVAQAERYFMNRIVPGEDRAFNVQRWRELRRPETVVPPSQAITIGIDGARFRDALAVVACHIESGFMWPLGIWERPEDADEDYEHPMDEVDGVVSEAWREWDVWRIYIDPGSQHANINPLMERWQGRWTIKRVIEWQMNRPKATAYMIRNFASAILTGDVTHGGPERLNEILGRHVANARRKKSNVQDEDGREMHHITKESPNSPLKIDGAAAAALAWEARGDAVAAGRNRKSSMGTCLCNRHKFLHQWVPEKGCPAEGPAKRT